MFCNTMEVQPVLQTVHLKFRFHPDPFKAFMGELLLQVKPMQNQQRCVKSI